MREAADRLDFERAIQVRELIKKLEKEIMAVRIENVRDEKNFISHFLFYHASNLFCHTFRILIETCFFVY